MKRSDAYLKARIEACHKLFIKYEGRKHSQIEREMRAMGFSDFNRRCLYARGINSGWIEKFRWDRELQWMQPDSHRRDGETPRGQNRLRERAASSAAAGPPIQNPKSKIQNQKPLNAFHAWLKKVSPPSFDWDARHLRLIIKKLQQMTEGKKKRLMIFMPPRHGKSELVTTRYTAWRLLMQPALKFILASYNQHLANRFSRNIRNTLAEHFSIVRRVERVERVERVQRVVKPENSQHSQDPLDSRDSQNSQDSRDSRDSQDSQNSQDSRDSRDSQDSHNSRLSNPFRAGIINTAAEWETGAGGGVKAVGVGGGITGYGAGLIVIDDPIKSREQAESASYRDKVWHWFNDDIMTRLEPNAEVVLIQTRWHEDDLAGRLLKRQAEEGTDEWEVLSLPALAEEVEDVHRRDTETPRGRDTGSSECALPLIEPDDDAEDPAARRNAGTPACHGCDSSHRHAGASHTSADPKPSVPSAACGGIAGKGARGPMSAAARRNAGTPACHGCHSSQAIRRLDEEIKKLTEPKEYPYIFENGRKVTLYPFGTLKPQYALERVLELEKQKADLERQIKDQRSKIKGQRDILGRRPGRALWPERFDEKALEKIRKQMGTYSFEALYQQRPVPTEGGLFKRSWFTIVQVPPPDLKWKRGYDLSFTANPDSDYSATVKVAFDKDGVLYIDDLFRGKIEYPLQRKMLMHYIRTETRTEHGIELSANGHAILQELRRTPSLYGRNFRGIKVETNKVARALPWIALAEEGRVRRRRPLEPRLHRRSLCIPPRPPRRPDRRRLHRRPHAHRKTQTSVVILEA